jgi:hypothetical protein
MPRRFIADSSPLGKGGAYDDEASGATASACYRPPYIGVPETFARPTKGGEMYG